jgi:hypothetical protein
MASSGSPVYNPCIVIENWDAEEAGLTVNDWEFPPGPDFRYGIEKNADEVSSLVVWFRMRWESRMDIKIRGSSGILGDINNDGVVNFLDFSTLVGEGNLL